MGAVDLAGILGQVLPVEVEEDGALTVSHDGTLASIRQVEISEGLDMVSLNQLLAWDVVPSDDLRKSVAAQGNRTMLGAVVLTERSDGLSDVMLRYNFPVGGLDEPALQTLVLMVLAGGALVRRALV